jgi:hypothetical protein
MIGWNTPGSSRDIDLHTKSTMPGSVAIAELYEDVIDAYDIDLIPEIILNGSGASDHASFWQYGYDAILGIEDFGDFNPYYHSTNDLLAYMDLDYFTEFVRASIGAFAHMTSCMIPSGSLEGHVSQAEDGLPIEGADVSMVSATGWEESATTDSSGYYTSTTYIGTYTVTVSAEDYIPATVGGVELLTDTVTTLDFALVPVRNGALDGHVTDAESGALITGASVYIEDLTGWNTTTTTDSDGYYTYTLEFGTYTVTVSAAGYIPATAGGVEVLTDTVTTLDFDLVPVSNGGLDGHVTDAEGGALIIDASVFIEGTYTVTVSAVDYFPATAGGVVTVSVSTSTPPAVEVLTDTVTTLDFVLVPVSNGALDGHVTDAESGALIFGASVHLEDVAGWNTTVTTDDTGYYTATIEIGTYTVTVSAVDYMTATVGGVEILSNAVSTLDIELLRDNYILYLPIWLHES